MQPAAGTPRAAFFAGVRDILPILLGVLPFGLISGVAAVRIGLSAVTAFVMSVIVFAGAAQLAAIQLLSVGATATVIVLTALIVNLRFVMYSAALAPHFARLPAPWKWMLAYLITDHAFAVFITHCNDTPNARHKHWYFFGAALGFWLTWQATTLVGIVLGAQVPPGWSLDFAIPLTFLVLVVPTITDRPSLAAAITAGSIAIVGATWPYNTGLISAALLGVAVGRLLEARQG